MVDVKLDGRIILKLYFRVVSPFDMDLTDAGYGLVGGLFLNRVTTIRVP